MHPGSGREMAARVCGSTEVLPDEVKVWFKERKPRTSEEAGQLAEDYRQARKRDL